MASPILPGALDPKLQTEMTSMEAHEKMSTGKLKALAKRHGISLDGCKNNSQRIQVINDELRRRAGFSV